MSHTSPGGLRGFDLGTVPASVTPPPSWRRAAWFAVSASVAVVIGLAVAAAALVGKQREPQVLDALPGLPTPQMLNPIPTDGVLEGSSTGRGSSSRSSSGSTTTSSPTDDPSLLTSGSPGSIVHLPGGGTTIITSGSRPTGGTSSTTGSPTRPATPPSRSTTNAYPFEVTDAKKVGDKTEQYYMAVTDNPDAAYAMTTGQMRSEGKEALRKKYANVSRVEVKKIIIDPSTSTSRSVVRIVKKDGTAHTEERELRFSTGNDPKISSETAH
ncbi:hypothetical protein [Herbihabitans rhizosphaerae]|nr:hypothetical protein [Herbihabitans rhizosphaerae]